MTDADAEPAGPLSVHEAIAAVIRDLPAIGKDQRVTDGAKYMYRGIEQIKAALKPLLAQHGVHYAPTSIVTVDDTTYQSGSGATWQRVRLIVAYRIWGPDGSWIDAVGRGEGADNSDKACNKAMTTAEKQVLGQVFCIADSDGDPDESRPDEQVVDTRPMVNMASAKGGLVQTIGKDRAVEWWSANDPGPGPFPAAQWDAMFHAAKAWAESAGVEQTDGQVPSDSTDEGSGAVIATAAPEPPPDRPTQAQMRRLFAALKGAGIADDERADWATLILGRDIDSFNELSRGDVATLTEKADASAQLEGAS